MNKTTAISIVQSINPAASEAIVNDLLEESKGVKSGIPAYRPYIVAAKTLSLNPPNADLKKADEVEWFDWQRRIKELISTQLMSDVVIDDIPIGWLADNGDILPLAAISSTQVF